LTIDKQKSILLFGQNKFKERRPIAMVVIKWTNKFSNETSHVASLSTKNK
jgi:hypothetical protein